jgi:hypothetical protein
MMYGIGGGVLVAIVGAYFIINQGKAGAPPDKSGQAPAKPDTSQHASAPQLTPVNTKLPQKGTDKPPANSETKPAPAVTPPGGTTTPADAFDKDLKNLESLTAGGLADDKDQAATALAVANRLVDSPKAIGNTRGRIFFARGFARLTLDEKSAGGCADLLAAKNLATDPVLIHSVTDFLKNTNCQ